NGASVTLAPSLVASDPNATVLVSATVALTGGFAGDGDVLAAEGLTSGLIIDTGNTITVAYDSTAETLTLPGTGTLAAYQTALDQVTFTTPSDNPTNFGANPSRTAVWTVNDGKATNNIGTATSTIDITAVHDPPTVTATETSVSFT